jgi:hypothetical protein
MVELQALWLPILVSAVIVFVASSLVHMVLPWHKSDYPKLPGEDAFRAAVGPMKLPAGDYMVPRARDNADMATPEFNEKLKEGPVMILTVLEPGPWKMGSNLAQWFVFLLVVGVFAAYVAGRALGEGAHYLAVFRFAGVTAFCCYVLGVWPISIWYKRGWILAIKTTFDGLIYGLLTGGVFGWLWPR